MKKIICLFGFIAGICYSGSVSAESLSDMYRDFKSTLAEKTGISYEIDFSATAQRLNPNGKRTPIQFETNGTLSWALFDSEKYGKGTIDIEYTVVRYQNKNALLLENRVGVVTEINDDTTAGETFDELSYTHTIGDFSVTLGQIGFSSFDGTAYDSNQQENFLNEALSQNASATYSSASLGVMTTYQPTAQWQFAGGLQDAENVSGSKIEGWKDDKISFFVSSSFMPTSEMTFAVMLYHMPSVPEQIGKSNGWSVNLSYQLTENTGVFARLNGAVHSPAGIKQSYVAGGIFDKGKVGLAFAVNKLNRHVNGAKSRSFESIFEGYYLFQMTDYLSVTPDIQFYINPALNRKVHTATVFSIRADMTF